MKFRNKTVVVCCVVVVHAIAFERHSGPPAVIHRDRTNVDVIEYSFTVTPDNPHLFEIGMTIPAGNADTLVFKMPRWAPGIYHIRDYASKILNFTAKDVHGYPLPVKRKGSNGWQVIPDKEETHVLYQIKPTLESWTGRKFDSTYVLVEGPGTFMYIAGKKKTPVLVDYNIPDHWQICSALDSTYSRYVYEASDYDALIDAPTQLGHFSELEFAVEHATIVCVFHGEADFIMPDFLAMVKKICEYQSSLFDELPLERYVFFYKILPGRLSGGGLEHRNSTTIGLSGNASRKVNSERCGSHGA